MPVTVLKAWIRLTLYRRQLKNAKLAVASLQKRLGKEGVSDRDAAVPVVAAAREVERIEAEIELIRTGRLILKGIRLGLDPPPEEWLYTRQVLHENGSRAVSTLTRLGEAKFRRQILTEKRSRWEFWLKLIPPIILALTGLLGTLIGVVALLKK